MIPLAMISFARPWLLCMLAVLPLWTALHLWTSSRRRRALAMLGASRGLSLQIARRVRMRRRAMMFLFPGMICLALASAGPQWGRDWGQSTSPGRDVIVVLDCSRSMLAETPTRLARAQEALTNLAGAVRRRGGHRLGLVLFAARAKLVCPLTQDYDHFQQTLALIPTAPFDPELGPGEEQTSGTRIGLGIVEALRARDEFSEGVCEIILLSDGDDPSEDREWGRGLAVADALQVPVHVIGIGDPIQGSTILHDGEPLEHGGQPVITRLQEAPLREIAQRTAGQYIDARTKAIPLGELYLETIATLPLRQASVDALPVYQQRSMWFFLPAFVFLLIGLFLRSP
jgi:Ca-activated chloride channel family protein